MMKPPTKWTEEMTAIAVGMKRAGFSAQKIGDRLGVTGSAVKLRTLRVGAKFKLNGKTGPKSGKTTKGILTTWAGAWNRHD